MTEITGVVESKKRDGKAIKVDGVWHGAYNAITLSGVNEGDMVTFTSVPSADGRFNNIKGKVLPVCSAGLLPLFSLRDSGPKKMAKNIVAAQPSIQATRITRSH